MYRLCNAKLGLLLVNLLWPAYEKWTAMLEGLGGNNAVEELVYETMKGLGIFLNPLINMVAGTGFEPVTFGL